MSEQGTHFGGGLAIGSETWVKFLASPLAGCEVGMKQKFTQVTSEMQEPRAGAEGVLAKCQETEGAAVEQRPLGSERCKGDSCAKGSFIQLLRQLSQRAAQGDRATEATSLSTGPEAWRARAKGKTSGDGHTGAGVLTPPRMCWQPHQNHTASLSLSFLFCEVEIINFYH